jgi:N-acetylmuramoyl-L-alanine amidase
LFEKDITLAIARRMRAELEQRGIPVQLLRDGDTTLSTDQRAISANTSRAAVYISVHATTLGMGVHLYTARFMSPVTIPDHGFLPWDIAQAKYLDRSHELAAALMTELNGRQLNALSLEAGLRPLRNIAKPAIVIEAAPPGTTVESLKQSVYQQAIADAVGTSVAKMRPSQEAAR